ncbi:MAG: hypothetical protein MUF54_24875, partial [Polyangiaceae bacterium]|nr:hypothetical protein [Polyangiaceae bacterium]
MMTLSKLVARLLSPPLLILAFAGCVCPVEDVVVTVENGVVTFRWGGGGLARICVTEPEYACPAAMNDKMPHGQTAMWFVSARGMPCFPDGIQPPVHYGQAHESNCMFDETAANGGVTGGVP